jgi:hypothetical protein
MKNPVVRNFWIGGTEEQDNCTSTIEKNIDLLRVWDGTKFIIIIVGYRE